MRARSIDITAADADSARRQAAGQLQLPPDAIHVEDLGDGRFRAEPADCDAELSVSLNTDMTVAKLSALPHRGKGRPASAVMVDKALAAAGVRLPPDPTRVKQALADLAAGREVNDAVVAMAIPPQRAEDASVEPGGNWQFPVFPGDPIGQIRPAKNARPGATLDGKRVLPDGKDKGNDLVFPDNAHCHVDKVSLAIRSEVYGLAEFTKDREIRVMPLLKIDKDDMRASARIFAKDFRGRPVTAERVTEAMKELGIVEELDAAVFASALAEANGRENGFVDDVTLCQGIRPVDGKDGWFDMRHEEDRTDVGETTEDGRIDFRARGVVKSVQAGTMLATLVPPKPGTPGRDIKGRVIPARDGVDFVLNVGDGIEVSGDGRSFSARDQGMVFFIDNNLDITDVFVTKGDVDYSIGNLSLEKGSVHVKGSILSGFSVQCPNNVLVDDVIESAIIKAGGDVQCKGGIIMERGGKVMAKGGVSALFAKNAVIESQGDVTIDNETNNCIIFARNRFFARRGRGKIVGSTIRAGKGIIANEIGSEMGVETTIHLGLERETDEEMIDKKKKLELTLQKIFAAIGKGDPKEILTRALPQKRKAVAEILKARIRCETELAEIDAVIERQREEMRKAMNATIKVHVKIHPGVIINCFGAVTKVAKEIPRSTIYFNPGTGKMEIGKL